MEPAHRITAIVFFDSGREAQMARGGAVVEWGSGEGLHRQANSAERTGTKAHDTPLKNG